MPFCAVGWRVVDYEDSASTKLVVGIVLKMTTLYKIVIRENKNIASSIM